MTSLMTAAEQIEIRFQKSIIWCTLPADSGLNIDPCFFNRVDNSFCQQFLVSESEQLKMTVLIIKTI